MTSKLQITITCLFVASFTMPGFGQSKFSVGPTVAIGYNFKQLEYSSNLNRSVGLRTELNISEKAGFRFGLSIINTGSRDATAWCLLCPSCYCGDYTEYDFTFISIPINFKYNITNKEKSAYYISGGITPYYIYKDIVRSQFPGPEEGETQYAQVGKPRYTQQGIFKQIFQVGASNGRHRTFNFNLCPGLEFKLSESLRLQTEFQVKYSLMQTRSSIRKIDNMLTTGIATALLFRKK